MSQLVVGTKSEYGWAVEVQGVGRAHAPELGDIERVARELLVEHGRADAATVDLQLLLPDFEVDLSGDSRPGLGGIHPGVAVVSGIILLGVVVGAVVFVLSAIA